MNSPSGQAGLGSGLYYLIFNYLIMARKRESIIRAEAEGQAPKWDQARKSVHDFMALNS